MKLTTKQQAILNTDGHIITEGGPGSGKTTVALSKAAHLAKNLKPEQRVLFLSFSNAAVASIQEKMMYSLSDEEIKNIEIDTYHSFFLRIVKTHGYLIGLPRRLEVMAGDIETASLAEKQLQLFNQTITEQDIKDERERLAREEGRVHFDYFAQFCLEIICGSEVIAKLIAKKYPTILLDEFQDTIDTEWEVMKILGKHLTLIALCDNKQRIYNFRTGASDSRPDDFKNSWSDVKNFNLGYSNHRSSNTDIATFGKDVSDGKNIGKVYSNVNIYCFSSDTKKTIYGIKKCVLGAVDRVKHKDGWSVAILTPAKSQVRKLSLCFQQPTGSIKKIPHSTIIDMESITKSAEIIGMLLQPETPDGDNEFIELICRYLRSRRHKGKPVKSLLVESTNLLQQLDCLNSGQSVLRTSKLKKLIQRKREIGEILLTGNIIADWLLVRERLTNLPGELKKNNRLFEDARDIPLLERGSILQTELNNDWRDNGCYQNALQIVRRAFLTEQLGRPNKVERGVVITNIDKSKGKEFDEVIIIERFPSAYAGKLVREDQPTSFERQRLNVAVTRARERVTILTPKQRQNVMPCPLLF